MNRIFVAGIAALLAVIYGATAWGATYNFNFNNVEQGENGQASPSLWVREGVPAGAPEAAPAAKSADAVKLEEGLPTGSAPAPVAAKEKTAAAVAEASVPSLPTRKWGALDLGVLGMDQEYGSIRLGLSAGLTWSPWKYLGLRVFGGTIQDNIWKGPSWLPFLGTELEIVPVHVSLFGQEDWLTLGVFGGLSSLGYVDWIPGSAFHGGIRARVGITEWLGILGQARISPRYAAVEAGVTFSY